MDNSRKYSKRSTIIFQSYKMGIRFWRMPIFLVFCIKNQETWQRIESKHIIQKRFGKNI